MNTIYICGNCKHFFQTGMAKSMSDGKMGYCLLIQNDDSNGVERNEQGIRKAKSSAIKRINDCCEKFEEK